MSKEQPKKLSEVINEERVIVQKPSLNPVEKAIADAEADQVRELNRARLGRIMAEEEAKTEKARRALRTAGGGDTDTMVQSLMANAGFRKDWLEYSDEQRAVFLGTFQAMRSGGGDSGAMGAFLPLMIMQMRSNPGSSVKEMVELIRVVSRPGGSSETVELLKIMLPLIAGNKQDPSILTQFMALIKPIYDTLSTKDKELYNQQFEFLRSQISSPTETIRGAMETAQAMGLTRGSSELEVEKLRMEAEERRLTQDRWITEQNWLREDAKEARIAQQHSDEKKWAAFERIGTQWAEKAAPVINAAINKGATMLQPGQGPQTQQPQPQNPSPQPQEYAFPCTECGTSIPVKGPPFPEKVTCPECDAVHEA